MNHRYLSNEELKGFSNYKYSSIDNSPLAVYVSHPFWNQIVKLYPMWLAPNVLTFGGMVLVMSAFCIVSYYDYDLMASSSPIMGRPPVPHWVWLYCAVSTFLAHTMDGTDGKQARRTGSSGPTGELFDHGIDSWLTVPFAVTMFSVLGRADFSVNAFRLMLVLMSAQIVFITTHWEKYNTGVLFLSWCYDASQYCLVILYMVTWACGGFTFWKFYLPFVYPSTPAQVAEIFFYFSCFGVSIPMSLYNIHKTHAAGTLKQSNLYEALLPMFSVVLLYSIAILWALYSPSDVLNVDPRAYYWTFGTVFSNIACRLIVAQMTSTRCQVLNKLTCLYALVGFCCLWPGLAIAELWILRALAVVITLAHLHYTICVVRQMCNYFDINCFSIKKKTTSVEIDRVSLLSPDGVENA